MLVQFSNCALMQDPRWCQQFSFWVIRTFDIIFWCFRRYKLFWIHISVCTVECCATLSFQWMSLMIAYVSDKCLSTIRTHNVAANTSCMVFVIEPVLDVELVGRIRSVYNKIPSFSLLNLVYWASSTKCLTSSDAYLK